MGKIEISGLTGPSTRSAPAIFLGFCHRLHSVEPPSQEPSSSSLWDKGGTSMGAMGSMKPMGMAMPGAMMDMATMGITVDNAEIPSGEVTFQVINESQEFYHSVTISPVADPSNELPYLTDKMMVDEATAGTTARVKEMRPRDYGSVTVNMQPGTYILYCNVAGHYVIGMWTMITVTG